MELSTSFLIYAAVFRLAVIGVGVIAIVLGYLLFVRAAVTRSRTEAGLEIAEIKLNLKNAAPGTCFAAFGAGIVLAMLVGGSPSLTMETAQNVAAAEQDRAADQVIRLKGGSLSNLLAAAASRAENGDQSGAMAAYSDLLKTPGLSTTDAALALEPMARIALARANHDQAETLARLAVLFSGDAPDTLDTLARILIARGMAAEAAGLAQRAVDASPDEPRYLDTLATAEAKRDQTLGANQ